MTNGAQLFPSSAFRYRFQIIFQIILASIVPDPLTFWIWLLAIMGWKSLISSWQKNEGDMFEPGTNQRPVFFHFDFHFRISIRFGHPQFLDQTPRRPSRKHTNNMPPVPVNAASITTVQPVAHGAVPHRVECCCIFENRLCSEYDAVWPPQISRFRIPAFFQQ